MFVTRASFDRLSKSLDDSRDELKRAMEYNRTLVQMIVDMRREGFTATPAPAAKSETERSRANLEEAIRFAAGNDRAKAGVLRKWVYSQRGEGKDDETIARALLTPLPDDDEGVAA